MISLRWERRILPGGLLWLCGIIVGLLMAVPIVSPASAQSSRDVLRLFDSLQRSVPHYQAPRQRSRARQNREAVYRAQTMLNALGYNAGPEDGAMGPRTRGALTAFQRDRGLSRSGRPDAQTMAALQQAVRSRTASQPAPAPAPASPPSQAPAPATEFVGYYEASSRTASAITGDITVAPETITFGNGATIGLRPVHQRGTFAVDPPADPELLQGTTLCGTAPPQFVVLAQNNPDFLGLSVFADRQDPVGQQLCAYYTYERGTAPPAAPSIAAAPGGAVIGAATPAVEAARTSFAPNGEGGPTISILGVTIAEPVSVEIPVEWHQVRDFVPDELLATPAEPLTQAQVGARVSAMRAERGADYDRALDLLATVAAAANPEYERDFIKLVLAEWSISPPLPGEVISDIRADVVISGQIILRPETQALAKSLEVERLAKEHAALSLIADTFDPAGMDPAAAPVAMQAQPTPGAAPALQPPSGAPAASGVEAARTVSVSGESGTGAFSVQDLEIIQRCKRQIFDAHGLPESARDDERILGIMGVTLARLQCDERLPNTVNMYLDPAAGEVSLLVVEPVCEDCSLNIELYCRKSITDPAGLTGSGIIYAEPGRSHASYGWIIRPFIEALGAEPVATSPIEWDAAFHRTDASCIAHLNIGEMPASEARLEPPDDAQGMPKGEPTVFGMHADISPSEAYALLDATSDNLSWRRLGVDATCSRYIFHLAEKSTNRKPRTLTGQHPFIAVFEDTISAGGRRRDAEFHCSEIKFAGDKVYKMQCTGLEASRSDFMAYVNAAREPASFTSDNNGGLATWECSPGASAGTCEMSLSYSHVQRQLVLNVSRDLEFLSAVNAEQEVKPRQACGFEPAWGAPAAPASTKQQKPPDTPVVKAPPRPEPARIAVTDKERELERLCIGYNYSWYQRDCACVVEQFRTKSAEFQQGSVHNMLGDLDGCMNEAAVRDELTRYCGMLNNTRARANQIGGGRGPQTPMTDCGCYSAELGDWVVARNVIHRKAFGRKSAEIAVQCR